MERGHDFDAIREANPLADKVSNYVKLKKSSGGYVGLCPFHQERTPSFHVYDSGSYHCYGCGEHGDVIDFVSKIQGTSIGEAARDLSDSDYQPTASQVIKRRSDREAERIADQLEAIEKARARWENAVLVEGTTNEYLERKKVPPHNARKEGDNLLLPMFGDDGEIQSVQSIRPDGSKKFHPGAPAKNARMMIGVHLGRTFICEGFATGASIFEAIPDQVCIAFSKDNVVEIARDFHARGTPFVLAADRNAEEKMTLLATELGCPIVLPDIGDDFNDFMIASGVDTVVESINAQIREYGRAVALLPPPATHDPFDTVDAFDYEEADIPLRPWIIPGVMLRGATHLFAAPGGTGKSLFTLQLAMVLATGMKWGHWQPREKAKVLIINAEDDLDEQRRRISAARTTMGVSAKDIGGRIRIARKTDNLVISRIDGKTGMPSRTDLVDELREYVKAEKFDVVIVDPFAETFEGDENSNSEAPWAMKLWRDEIARAANCAVYLVHHTAKGSADKGAGNADVIRGAGGLVNSARMAATLFLMTPGEASGNGVSEKDRYRYVRYDDAKSNQSLLGSGARWFEKVSVCIGNGDAGYSEGWQAGDDVGALLPTSFDGTGGVDTTLIMNLLRTIDQGYVDDEGVFTDMPFTKNKAGSGSKRWVGYVASEVIGHDEDSAKLLIRSLCDRQVLTEIEWQDTAKGRVSKGLKVDFEKAEMLYGDGTPNA